MAINRTKQARQMLNNAGAVEQDGVMNYIKNSESVTVPKEFKARGNAPSTKLAYITADEAKMLKKQKPGTPHKGPKGIPSYDSFDAQGGFTSGAAMSAAETGDRSATGRADVRSEFGPKGLAPGVTPNEVRDLRSSVIAAGAGRRVNPGFFDSRNVISPAELAAARAFAKDRNNRFARAAMRNRDGGILGFITSGGLLGNLVRGLGQKFGLGKRFNEPTYDMSKFNELGLMGQVPEDFEDEKISLTSFIKPEDTIGRVDLNDLEGILDDKGLTEVPGIITDEGLTEVPGIITDEGLTEVPADSIDQGITTASSVNDFPVKFASALTTPTAGKFGLNLMQYSTLKNNRYNDSQIQEAIKGGYVNDLIKTLTLANGGRINAMDGGLMNLDGARQMMFIGGIAKAAKKAVKKVTRGVKKIVKSPLGKAALLGAGLYFTRGTGGGILEKFNNLKPFQKALFGIGATSALAGLTTPKEEDEEIDLEEYYKQAMINPNAPLSRRILGTEFAANGGRIGYAEGSKEPVAKKVMPLLDMDGMEKDYRADGGFVPIGRMEKADDVPARLSKNEFVFTADAVRNAGGGDVDKGSEVMYNMMKNLEAGGEISEESQGLEGAREMFQTSQRLGEVI